MAKTAQRKLKWEQTPTGFSTRTEDNLIASFNGSPTTWSEFVVTLKGDPIVKYSNPQSGMSANNPLASLLLVGNPQPGIATVRLLHKLLVVRTKNGKINTAMKLLESL